MFVFSASAGLTSGKKGNVSPVVPRPWRQGDTGSVRLHHRWGDDQDRPQPDLTDPATAAALTRAARGVRMVKLIHLALLVLGLGLLALALLLRVD